MKEPIELIDDGLRFVASGEVCGARFVHLENPSLVSEVIFEKKRRSMILQANERMFA